MHYHLTERTDSEFWKRCQSMDIPDSLSHRLDLFKETGRVFQAEGDVFGENSWTQVMLGQGIKPKSYHPIVDMMNEEELFQFLAHQENKVTHLLSQLSNHEDFLAQYCPMRP